MLVVSVKLRSSYTDKIWSRNCSRVTVAKLFCQCKWGDMILRTKVLVPWSGLMAAWTVTMNPDYTGSHPAYFKTIPILLTLKMITSLKVRISLKGITRTRTSFAKTLKCGRSESMSKSTTKRCVIIWSVSAEYLHFLAFAKPVWPDIRIKNSPKLSKIDQMEANSVFAKKTDGFQISQNSHKYLGYNCGKFGG